MSLLILGGALFSLAGCSRLFGGRYDNFTAYYNTFYNAKTKYEEGVEGLGVGTQNELIDPNHYLPLFGNVGRVTQTQPFDEAIQKSADVLRDHPDSKWVDDALLLIGKSYYHQQNWAGAEQKFREVIAMDSHLEDEARFWLARSLIAAGPLRYEDATAHLIESLAREDLARRWKAKLHLAQAELDVKRQAWNDAALQLETGLEDLRDNELAARAQFLLGQIYETLGHYEEAVAAYRRATDYNPFYELSYEAQVGAIRVQGLYGDVEEALRQLRRMERDDKNYANRAKLAYLRGRLFHAAGRYDDALDTYYDVLYDSDAAITEVRGPIHYALGEFYRDVYEDFELAAAYFDTASTAIAPARRTIGGSRGGATAQEEAFAPAAITDSQEQAAIFGSFATVQADISRMDSLLYIGSLDDAAFDEFVLKLREQRAEEMAAQQVEMERRQAEQSFQQAGAGFDNRSGGKQIDVAGGGETQEAGFLFHRDPIRVQDGRAEFVLRWGDRPLAPNWRRAAALSTIADGGDNAAGLSGPGDLAAVPGSELPEVDLSGVPRDSLSQHQMMLDRAVARYELGNVLFLSMNRPDSAAVWYRSVIEENGDLPVAQRAYYALAEVQRALGDSLAANQLYRTILDRYPDSEFAVRAQERLGLQVEDQVAADSLMLAEAAYDEAYRVWRREGFAQALEDMLEVAARYRTTEVAPKALLAAGRIYMEWAQRDSLELFEALPVVLPDSLLQEGSLFYTGATQQTATPRQEGVQPAAQAPGKFDTPEKGRPVNEVEEETPESTPQNVPLPDASIIADSLVASDSLAVADTLGALPPDTLAAAAADSTARAPMLPADSLLVEAPIADSTAADSTANRQEPLRLETLYASLVNHFPQSPQAAQARRLLTALEEQRPKPTADSATAADSTLAPPDSMAAYPDSMTVADERVTPDSAQVAGESKPSDVGGALGLMDRDRRRRTPPVDSTALVDSAAVTEAAQQQALQDQLARRRAQQDAARTDTSQEAVQPSEEEVAPRTGWIIWITTEFEQARAENMSRGYRGRLQGENAEVEAIPVPVANEEGRYAYHVGIGPFETQEGAQEVLSKVAAKLPQQARLLDLSKPFKME